MHEESSFVLQGSVASTAVAFLQSAVLRMIPYSMAAIPLIVLDLIYGIRAAKFRGENIKVSTALRRSVTKVFTYVCWLVLASTIALAFSQSWLEWLVLGLVYGNEFFSIVGNFLETKGWRINWKTISRAGLKLGGQKVGLDTEGIDPATFVVPIDQGKKEGDETAAE